MICAVSSVLGILHGVVPVVLVAISDTIAAVVLAVVAVVWALVLLAGAIIAIVKTVQVTPPCRRDDTRPGRRLDTRHSIGPERLRSFGTGRYPQQQAG